MINSVTSYKSSSKPVAVPGIKIFKYTFVKTLPKTFFIYYRTHSHANWKWNLLYRKRREIRNGTQSLTANWRSRFLFVTKI